MRIKTQIKANLTNDPKKSLLTQISAICTKTLQKVSFR